MVESPYLPARSVDDEHFPTIDGKHLHLAFPDIIEVARSAVVEGFIHRLSIRIDVDRLHLRQVRGFYRDRIG